MEYIDKEQEKYIEDIIENKVEKKVEEKEEKEETIEELSLENDNKKDEIQDDRQDNREDIWEVREIKKEEIFPDSDIILNSLYDIFSEIIWKVSKGRINKEKLKENLSKDVLLSSDLNNTIVGYISKVPPKIRIPTLLGKNVLLSIGEKKIVSRPISKAIPQVAQQKEEEKK